MADEVVSVPLPLVLYIMGFIPVWAKLKIIKLTFVTSPLGHQWGIRTQTGWSRVMIIYREERHVYLCTVAAGR